jgi:hypothetical protein
MEAGVRDALYRPFCSQFAFFDEIFNEDLYQLPEPDLGLAKEEKAKRTSIVQ